MAKWKRDKSRKWIRNALINKFGNICGICTEPILNMKDVTIDHIIPKALGGLDVWDNYQIAHYECNQTKGCMSPEEFELLQLGLMEQAYAYAN